MNNSVDISEAMSMTLDEYAEKTGMYVSSFLKQPKINNSCKQKSKFDRIDDDDVDMEEDEDNLLQINEDDDCLQKEIKKELINANNDDNNTDDNTDNNSFDLRFRLNEKNIINENSTSKKPKASSIQWRVMFPNNLATRPSGMPPLRDSDAEIDSYNVYQRKHVAENNYVANCETGFQKNGNRNNQNNGNRNNRNRGNYNNNVNTNYHNRTNNNNNRKIPYNNNNGRNNMNNNYYQRGYNQNEYQYNNGYQNNNQTNNQKPIPLMSIAAQSCSINSSSLLNSANNCNALIPNVNSDNSTIKQLSAIAETYLETLRKASAIKELAEPKYDMKVQKEIHELQKKQLIYKYPTGEVISCDGPGVDLKINPTSSGISINQRFSSIN